MLRSIRPIQFNPLSIIVPTLNEVESARSLMARIDAAMHLGRRGYEVIVIDDHSTDGTAELLKELATDYPICVVTKQGAPGKAQSLIEGFALARYELVAMIDADLQYPPEALPDMADALEAGSADIVLTHRRSPQTSLLRRTGSAVFQFTFARLMFGLNYDTQSGLKLFRKHILTGLQLNPAPWSFDLEFIVRSQEKGAVILEHDILFSARQFGEAKIDFAQASFELARAAINLKFTLLAEGRGGTILMALKRQLLMTLLAGLVTVCLSAPVQAEDLPVTLPTDPIEILLPTPVATPTPGLPTSPISSPNTAPSANTSQMSSAKKTLVTTVKSTIVTPTPTAATAESTPAPVPSDSFLSLASASRTSSFRYPLAKLDPDVTARLSALSIMLGSVGLLMAAGGLEMIATLSSNLKNLFRLNTSEEQ